MKRIILIFLAIKIIFITFLSNSILNKTIEPRAYVHEQADLYSMLEKHIVEIVIIDPNFTDTEKFLILQSLNEWQVATNNVASFYVVYDENLNFKIPIDYNYLTIVRMRPAKSNDPFIKKVDEATQEELIGYYDGFGFIHEPITNLLIVRERITSEEEYKGVVMHEIGHSLGLMHINDPNTLMYPTNDSSSFCPTKIDLMQFCDIFKCKIENLKPCNAKKVKQVYSVLDFLRP
jgi:hypothetical protein